MAVKDNFKQQKGGSWVVRLKNIYIILDLLCFKLLKQETEVSCLSHFLSTSTTVPQLQCHYYVQYTKFCCCDHILSKGCIVLLEQPPSLRLNCYVNNPLLGQIHCFTREDKHSYLMTLFVSDSVVFSPECRRWLVSCMYSIRSSQFKCIFYASTCENLCFNVAS